MPDEVELYYNGMSDNTVDLLLNWGPIVVIPIIPFISLLLSRPRGLKISIQLGALLSALGCAVRLVPSFLSSDARANPNWWLFLHFGQIFNAGGFSILIFSRAASGPIFVAAPSLLSAVCSTSPTSLDF